MIENKISFEGIILKIERLAQGKEQKEIVGNICSVSTLSKIERGKQRVDKEMLTALYKELGIEYERDEKFLKEMKFYINEIFNDILYNISHKNLEKLKENHKRLKHSPLVIDYLIILALENDGLVLNILDETVEFMTPRQLGWYYLIDRYEDDITILDKSLKSHSILQNSMSMLNIMKFYWSRGEFKKLDELVNQAINIALEEGNTWALSQIYFFKGGIYSCFNMEEYMIKEYERGINLLLNTNWNEDLSSIYYNMGATYISLKNYDKAREYLNKSQNTGFYYYHKIVALELALGNIEEAKINLLEMEKYLKDYIKEKQISSESNDFYKSNIEEMTYLFEAFKLKVYSQEKDNPEYISFLEKAIKSYYKRGKYGYLIFNKTYLKEAYIQNRRYKEALELEELISNIKSKSTL